MALVIGVHEGDRIYFNHTPARVVSVHGFELIQLEVDGKVYNITPLEATEVLPKVRISVGVPRTGTGIPRLAIEAPREVVVLREELYERSKLSA